MYFVEIYRVNLCRFRLINCISLYCIDVCLYAKVKAVVWLFKTHVWLMFYMSIGAGVLLDILSSQIKSPASALNCILEYANQQTSAQRDVPFTWVWFPFGENPAFLPSFQNSRQKCKNGIKCSAEWKKIMFSKCWQRPTLTFTNLREEYWIKKSMTSCCNSLNCTMSDSITAPEKKKKNHFQLGFRTKERSGSLFHLLYYLPSALNTHSSSTAGFMLSKNVTKHT